MPEPYSKYSTDKPIYYLTKKLSPYLCFIHPNIISILGFLFVIPIIYNMYANRGWGELIVLGFIRQFLDCLDGTVARKCNTGSNFGAKLDIGLDLLTAITISLYAIAHLIFYPPHISKIIIISVLICMTIFGLSNYLFDKEKADKNNTNIDDIELDPFFQFCHDNSMIAVILLLLFLKKMLQ
jgi:phosphatidylglycerophosphate synthase